MMESDNLRLADLDCARNCVCTHVLMLTEGISENECESLPQEPLIFDEWPQLPKGLCISPPMDECGPSLGTPKCNIEFMSAFQTPKANERFTTPQAFVEGTSSIRPVDGSPALRQLETDSGWTDCAACKKKVVGRPIGIASEVQYETKIPEQSRILWQIKDFSAFRHASKKADLPSLRSPDIGDRGLKACLYPYSRKGDVILDFRLPECLNSPATTYCLAAAVISPVDGAEIISRELTVTIQRGKKPQRPSVYLWRRRLFNKTGYKKLLHRDQLTLNLAVEVYDHTSTPFVGIPAFACSNESNDACLLQDIREFCETHPSQTIQISCGTVSFTACRFLLQARSKKMRVLLADRDKNWQKLELRDIEPAVLEQVLSFIHTNTCDYINDEGTEDSILLKLLVACSAYHIPSLAARICDTLRQRLQMHNVLTYWEAAKSCELCGSLSQACCQYLDSLPGSRVADMMRKHSTESGAQKL